MASNYKPIEPLINPDKAAYSNYVVGTMNAIATPVSIAVDIIPKSWSELREWLPYIQTPLKLNDVRKAGIDPSARASSAYSNIGKLPDLWDVGSDALDLATAGIAGLNPLYSKAKYKHFLRKGAKAGIKFGPDDLEKVIGKVGINGGKETAKNPGAGIRALNKAPANPNIVDSDSLLERVADARLAGEPDPRLRMEDPLEYWTSVIDDNPNYLDTVYDPTELLEGRTKFPEEVQGWLDRRFPEEGRQWTRPYKPRNATFPKVEGQLVNSSRYDVSPLTSRTSPESIQTPELGTRIGEIIGHNSPNAIIPNMDSLAQLGLQGVPKQEMVALQQYVATLDPTVPVDKNTFLSGFDEFIKDNYPINFLEGNAGQYGWGGTTPYGYDNLNFPTPAKATRMMLTDQHSWPMGDLEDNIHTLEVDSQPPGHVTPLGFNMYLETPEMENLPPLSVSSQYQTDVFDDHYDPLLARLRKNARNPQGGVPFESALEELDNSVREPVKERAVRNEFYNSDLGKTLYESSVGEPYPHHPDFPRRASFIDHYLGENKQSNLNYIRESQEELKGITEDLIRWMGTIKEYKNELKSIQEMPSSPAKDQAIRVQKDLMKFYNEQIGGALKRRKNLQKELNQRAQKGYEQIKWFKQNATPDQMELAEKRVADVAEKATDRQMEYWRKTPEYKEIINDFKDRYGVNGIRTNAKEHLDMYSNYRQHMIANSLNRAIKAGHTTHVIPAGISHAKLEGTKSPGRLYASPEEVAEGLFDKVGPVLADIKKVVGKNVKIVFKKEAPFPDGAYWIYLTGVDKIELSRFGRRGRAILKDAPKKSSTNKPLTPF